MKGPLFLSLALLLPSLAWGNLPTEPGLDAWTLKKMRWLEKYGTPVKAGSPDRPFQTLGCNRGDEVILRHQWGLEQTWIRVHLVECPAFFSARPPQEN